MRRTLLTVVLAAVAVAVLAGDEVETRLTQIRRAYAAREAMIANKPFEDQPFNEVTIDMAINKAGLGVTDSRMTYHFTDEGPAEDTDVNVHSLFFVHGTYSNSMRSYNHYIELLYDSETGTPMFALVSMIFNDDESTRHTLRVYMDDEGEVMKTVPAADGFFRWVEESPFVTDIVDLNAVKNLFDQHRDIYRTVTTPLWDYRK